MDRILADDYRPINSDIIHSRTSTAGVHEIVFTFKKHLIRLIDVGGQKSERRKWIHCFEQVTAVLFVASLSSYDMFHEENRQMNRLCDSVELFDEMLNNRYLLLCSFILFLNKKDLFEEKLQRIPLSKYFPNYKGKNDYKSASEFIKSLFMQGEIRGSRNIYVHFTNATDTNNIDLVFSAACDIILQSTLQKSGLT
uniref:G-protein alpha subunit n=1 Tax=Ascaris lumbricoides TaxID=6252 RepID=A0A0M3IHC8_ASCLU